MAVLDTIVYLLCLLSHVDRCICLHKKNDTKLVHDHGLGKKGVHYGKMYSFVASSFPETIN